MKPGIIAIILLWCSVADVFCQTRTAKRDTVPYKVGYYDIKKQTKVFLVAEKLNVNPVIIVKLNKFRNIEQNLYKNQRIKIPVYPRGYKYEPEKELPPVNNAPAVVAEMQLKPGKDTVIDDDALPVKPDIEEIKIEQEYVPTAVLQNENKVPVISYTEEPVKPVETAIDTATTPLAVDSVAADTLLAVKEVVPPAILPSVNPAEDSASLEMLDVMMELNEAILAGTLASLDSIDAVDSTDLNEGDMKDVLRRMRKARARVLLRPELLATRDSISNDIVLQKEEHRQLIGRLEAYQKQQEALRLAEATRIEEEKRLLALQQAKAPKPKEGKKKNEKNKDEPPLPSLNDEVEKEKKRKPDYIPLDTVIIIDLEPWKINVQSVLTPNSLQLSGVPVMAKTADTIVHQKEKPKPFVSDTGYFNRIKAATYKADSITRIEPGTMQETTLYFTPDVADTTGARPGGTQQKIVPHFAATVAEQNYKQYYSSNTPVYLIPVDSVRKIKAEFFFRRAEKSLEDKNLKNTQSYLKKALELNPNYFDAWLLTADLEAMYGSQTKAVEDYSICTQIDSTKQKLWYKIANLHATLKHKREAYDCYSKAIELRPDDILSLMGRAAIASDWKRYYKCIEDYDAILAITPNYSYAYKARGIVYHLSKDFPSAIADFDKYLELERKPDGAVYYYRGLSKIAAKDLLEGCMDLSKASSYGYKAADRAIAKSCE